MQDIFTKTPLDWYIIPNIFSFILSWYTFIVLVYSRLFQFLLLLPLLLWRLQISFFMLLVWGDFSCKICVHVIKLQGTLLIPPSLPCYHLLRTCVYFLKYLSNRIDAFGVILANFEAIFVKEVLNSFSVSSSWNTSCSLNKSFHGKWGSDFRVLPISSFMTFQFFPLPLYLIIFCEE